MTQSHRKVIILALTFFGIFAYFVGLSVGPRVSQKEIDNNRLQLFNITLSENFGISINTDSFFYMAVAKNPASVFQEQNVIQARPLLAFLAHFPSRLLETQVLGPDFGGAGNVFMNHFAGPYLTFITINFMALCLSYLLYMQILARGNSTQAGSGSLFTVPTAFICGGLLIVNDLTKAFFFAAHTQMLAIATPLMALAVAQRLASRKFDFRAIGLYSAGAGLGVLAYGSFLVVGAVIVSVLVYRYAWKKDISISQLIAGSILALGALLLPYAIWFILVKSLTGSFYIHEIAQWHQFVWMRAAADKGGVWLASRLADNLWFFLKSVLYHVWQFAAVALVFLYFSVSVWNALWTGIKADAKFFIWPLVVALLFLFFIVLLGYQERRLTFPCVVMVIVVLGYWAARLELILPKPRQAQLLLSTCVVMSIYGTVTVMKNGPFY